MAGKEICIPFSRGFAILKVTLFARKIRGGRKKYASEGTFNCNIFLWKRRA
jgi:hypothetical protein